MGERLADSLVHRRPPSTGDPRLAADGPGSVNRRPLWSSLASVEPPSSALSVASRLLPVRAVASDSSRRTCTADMWGIAGNTWSGQTARQKIEALSSSLRPMGDRACTYAPGHCTWERPDMAFLIDYRYCITGCGERITPDAQPRLRD